MNKLPLIKKGYSANMRFADEHSYSPHLTFFLFLVIVGISFAVLFIRLFELTIVKGSYYGRLSDNNRIRQILIEPRRGTILDRKGIVLVHNQAADLSGLSDELPSHRLYESPPQALAPVVGYRQVASADDLKNDSCLNKLQLGGKMGKKGIEEMYDCDLRGEYGKKLVEVDAQGESLRTINLLPPTDGKTIKLALDWELQKKAYDLIKDRRGAVVVLKPQTGEILVMASSPTYNPQDFEDDQTDKTAAYIRDPSKPLFNRASEGLYPPGSIFKLAVAVGGLEDKKIDEKTLIEDTGTLKAGSLSFGNWYYLEYGRTDGEVDIVKAIRRSNDIFFYQVGNLVGPTRIKHWAEILGFGKKTGFGLDEAEGTLPSPFWKKETFNENWYTGDTYNLSIGQGYLLVTPLQIAQATQAIANDGSLCTPQLLKDAPPNCRKLPISTKTLVLIHEGMKEACAPGGTGWPLFDFKIFNKTPMSVSCKTGTAESNSSTQTPHAWFTAYAPSDNPQIVVSVLLEESGQGSDVAGPLVHDILKSYFERSQ